MSLNIEVQIALDKIGKTGKTKLPISQDTSTPWLHELAVANIIVSTAKKRKEAALVMIARQVDHFNQQVIDAKDEVIDTETAVNSNVVSGENYNLDIMVKNGALYFDVLALRNHLLKTQTTDEVDKYLNQFYIRRSPSTSVTVTEKQS